jgi:hypothetical protein
VAFPGGPTRQETTIELPPSDNYDPAPMHRSFNLSLLRLFATCCGQPVAALGDAHDAVALIQPLIDPAKLATLGKRGANQRVEKIAAILWMAKIGG